MTIGTTVLGYPRIGPRRELKRAVERYWAGRIDEPALLDIAHELRASTWTELRDAGLESVPSNTFSFYDQVLDTAALFDAVPQRFRGLSTLDMYFAAARGWAGATALELTKWFDTNYHYLVPELTSDTRFRLVGDKPIAEFLEARELGITTRPVLLGPVTFLLLAKPAESGFDQLDLLDDLLGAYADLLARLRALRELLPLRAVDHQSYLDWSVGAFRLATAGAAPSTQIHTHLCYSEFGAVIDAIDGLDADVTTIEAARSKMEVLADLRASGFGRGVGPGVYDIHSPRVPSEDEIALLLHDAVRAIPGERLWVNPDCGLKTRDYAEVEPALRNLVAAARRVRGTVS